MNNLTQFITDLSHADQLRMERLRVGMILDRAETRALLRQLETLESSQPGFKIFVAQLQAMLERSDWVRLSVSSSSADSLRRFGATVAVIEYRLKPRAKARLSPLQRWQRDNQVGRKVW